MRILYHHRTLADGAEGIHIEQMVCAFRELGHEVRVVGPAASQSGTPGLAERIKAVVPQVGFELASIAWNVADYVRLRREISAFNPDFIYKRHGRYDVGAILAARHSSIPLVLEVNVVYCEKPYCDFEPQWLSPVAGLIERSALRGATAVCTVSSPLATQVRRLAGRNATVIPNAADLQRFDRRLAQPTRARARHGLAARLTVGWSGIIREWHGLELLVDAAARLPDLQLLIVGDGPGRRAIEARAAALRIQDRTFITGRVAHDEMPDYLAAMDIGVVADERTGVASPMKLFEYMAMELAVVAPRLPNIKDIVEDGASGLLFAPGDSLALARLLERLVADPGLRISLGREARRLVIELRNWTSNARTVLSLLEHHSRERLGQAARS